MSPSGADMDLYAPTGGICQRACLDFFSQFDIMLLRSNAEGAVRVESRGEVLNQFLVEVFGQILKAEAACLAGKDLSCGSCT